ncbi:MAG: hypothetical protein FJ211_00590 [Ignavibacteria bacterium]|nr:hypothetical protein [Ignavibacteria bacterium]
MKSLLIIAVALLASATAFSIPQFSAISGNRCINCHVAPSGGSVRNDLGWYSWYDVGAVPRSNKLFDWFYDKDSSNQFFDGKVILGMDARIQSTRSFVSESSPRRLFPMQASFYSAYNPIPEVTIEGSVNLATLAIQGVPPYSGMRAAAISAIIAPSFSLPSVRIGVFRPNIGMRYDDHTMAPYSYTLATQRKTVIAPDWSEVGAEVSYEGLKWLSLQAGVFGSQGLSQVHISDGEQTFSVVDGNQPTLTARAVVWPRLFNDKLNTWFGASLLRNNHFGITSGFAGIGLSDEFSLMLDYTRIEYDDRFESQSMMAELMYSATTWLFPYVRAERYTTDPYNASGSFLSNAATLGAQIFVMPYIEVRPEYRIWDTWKPGYSSRWNVQLHFFY